jgi:predicted nucleic acid-binding protein
MAVLFADTFYFIALLDSADARHKQAVAWSRRRVHSLLTTEYVLLELGDAFHSPGKREEFAVFQDAVRADPKLHVLHSSPQLYAAGLELFRRRTDKSWQLTDCISFALMEDRGVRNALTGDKHFEQAGFTSLLK